MKKSARPTSSAKPRLRKLGLARAIPSGARVPARKLLVGVYSSLLASARRLPNTLLPLLLGRLTALAALAAYRIRLLLPWLLLFFPFAVGGLAFTQRDAADVLDRLIRVGS